VLFRSHNIHRTFRSDTQRRLLHQGNRTRDILKFYISSIKSGQVLGIDLSPTIDIILAYLKSRADVTRCAIEMMMDKESDLEFVIEQDDDQDDFKEFQSVDLTKRLLQIHDERTEVFTSEVQSILAEKLLMLTDYNHDTQLADLEILKTILGQESLSTCEVMISDVSNSRRADTHVRLNSSETEIPEERLPLHSLIISHLFWPEDAVNNKPSFTPHPSVKYALDKYEKGFQMFKSDRQIEWLDNLGRVNVECEFEDGRIEDIECSPLQATLLLNFEDYDEMNLAEIEERLGVASDDAISTASFWVRMRVIALHDGVYRVIEHQSSNNTAHLDDEVDAASAPQTTTPGPSLDTFKTQWWTFISTMLKNLGEQSVDKIHGSLSRFGCKLSVSEFKGMMDMLVAEELLDLSGGSYRVRK